MAAVADRYTEITGLGADVLGISTDSIYSHKVFHEVSPSAKKVMYPLISDRTLNISRSYGVLDDKSASSYRATFIIDPNGKIKLWEVYPSTVGRNIDEIIRALKAIQYNAQSNEGTPANWQPGENGIKPDLQSAGKI